MIRITLVSRLSYASVLFSATSAYTCYNIPHVFMVIFFIFLLLCNIPIYFLFLFLKTYQTLKQLYFNPQMTVAKFISFIFLFVWNKFFIEHFPCQNKKVKKNKTSCTIPVWIFIDLKMKYDFLKTCKKYFPLQCALFI